MTKEEFQEFYDIEEPILVLEPWNIYSKGIIGLTEDKRHIVYEYFALVSALSKSYEEEWIKNGCRGEKPDFETDAMEQLDCDTIRSISYQNQKIRPIIIYEISKEVLE